MNVKTKPAPHQDKYKKKMIAAGYARVTVWVPKEHKDEFMDVLNELRETHERTKKA